MTPSELAAIERLSLEDCRHALALAEANYRGLHPCAQQALDARVLAIQARMLRLQSQDLRRRTLPKGR